MKIHDTEIKDVQLCEGENIKLVVDGERVIVSAPTINHTRIKNGVFSLFAEEIIIEAGRDIVITTSGRNKLIIGANIDKERARIVALETRLKNLETAIAVLIPEEKS